MAEDSYVSYTGPFRITETTTLKTFAISNKKKNSATVTATYTKSNLKESEFTVENGILTAYTGSKTDVIVPLYYNNTCVTGVDAGVFRNNTTIESVTLSQELITIGADAFNGCVNLRSVTAPGVEILDDRAFYGCSSLNGFTLSNLKTMGVSAFENAGTTTGTLSAMYSTSVGEKAFYNCGFKTVYLTNAQTIGAECFAGSQDLSSVNVSKATDLGDSVFKNCTSLQTVTLSAITTIPESTFSGCVGLGTINANKVILVENNAFYGCSSLKTIKLTALTTVGDYAFAGCGIENLTHSNIIALGNKSFGDCAALTKVSLAKLTEFNADSFEGSVNVTSFELPGVTSLTNGKIALSQTFPLLTSFSAVNCKGYVPDYYFRDCFSLQEVNLPSVTAIGISAFENTALQTYTLTKITSVGDYAFKNSAITAVSGVPNVVSVGQGCFSYIDELTTVSLSKLTSVDFSIFEGSSNITKLVLQGITEIPEDYCFSENFADIEYIDFKGVSKVPDYAFKGCQALSWYDFTNTVEIGVESFCGTAINNPQCLKVTSVGARAFAQCESLGEVNLPKLTTYNTDTFEGSESTITHLNFKLVNAVTDEEAFMFTEFADLQEIVMPNIPCVPAGAFEGCQQLKYVDLGTYNKAIGENTFKDCISLEEISLYYVTAIGNGAFENCKKLTRFSNGYIKDFDFDILKGCTELRSIELDAVEEFPVDETGRLYIEGVDNLLAFGADSLIEIPDHFLENYTNLSSVQFNSARTVGDYAFYGTSIDATSGFNKVEEIGDYAFYGTKTRRLEKNSYCYLEKIGDCAFAECTDLSRVDLSCISCVGTKSFENCTELKYVCLDNSATLTVPVDAFKGCSNVKQLHLYGVDSLPVTDEGLSYVSDMSNLMIFSAPDIAAVPDYYFIYNPELHTINLDNAKVVGEGAFENTALSTVTMPLLESAGDYSFYNTAITSLTFDRLTHIGKYAFAECSSLEEFALVSTGVEIGAGAFENDSALTKFTVSGDIAIPDMCFKNCTSLNNVVTVETGSYIPAYITHLGKESFSGCSSLNADDIRLDYLKSMDESCLAGVDFSDLSSDDVVMPALETAYENAFIGVAFRSLALENIKTLNDLPECEFAVIGSDIKNFKVKDSEATIYAYEGSVVEDKADLYGLNFKPYNTTDTVINDIADEVLWYGSPLSFEVAGFNLNYRWYGCNNLDRSDAEFIVDSGEKASEIDVIEPLFDTYNENKYRYFFCVAISTENGNVLEIESSLSKNLFATVGVTENTFADYHEQIIYTDSHKNIDSYNGIFTYVDDAYAYVSPSYTQGEVQCYGTGSILAFRYDGSDAFENTLVVYGDINGDGVVDALDASAVALASSGKSGFKDNIYERAADTNRDEQIDADDYQAVVNKLVS
ncbi:MAG: leucine-rich repeat protein [Clostridia bacterium]|nr:leucine-rich repeat protein [Clostridia bacterium]